VSEASRGGGPAIKLDHTLKSRLVSNIIASFKMSTRKYALVGIKRGEILDRLNDLGNFLRLLNQWLAESQIWAFHFAEQGQLLRQEHPSTLTSRANLASAYWNQGRWKEAEELEVQVWRRERGCWGKSIQTR
jgi:Tetratricopeptide repeat